MNNPVIIEKGINYNGILKHELLIQDPEKTFITWLKKR